jgi:hypothetical protein
LLVSRWVTDAGAPPTDTTGYSGKFSPRITIVPPDVGTADGDTDVTRMPDRDGVDSGVGPGGALSGGDTAVVVVVVVAGGLAG